MGALLYYTVSGDYAFLRASILTGSPTGAYHALGERLAARALKKNGHLKVVATDGSVENIARLVGQNGRCVPAFAFVQDGVPAPADAGLVTLGRLPQPESLFLLARRTRAINTFNDLKGASVGIGPDGSGTAYLMQQLMENSDLSGLGLKPSNHDLEAQAGLVRDGELDLAAFVMNENARDSSARWPTSTTSRSSLLRTSKGWLRGISGCDWVASPQATMTLRNRFPRPTSSWPKSTRW